MPKIKKTLQRLEIINRCLRSGWHTYEDMLGKLADDYFEMVSIRTLQNDLNELRSASEDNEDPIERRKVGGKMEFRYKDKHYSYTEPLVSNEQIKILQEAIAMLNKHKGIELANEVIDIVAILQKRNFEKIENSADYFQPYIYDNYSGSKYLLDLLECCRLKTVIEISYEPFGKSEQKHILHPILLKEWKGRWFVIGWNAEIESYSNFALDRIKKIKNSKEQDYLVETESDIFEKYKHILGVTLNNELKKETIIFRLNNHRAPYLNTKPVHTSQKHLRDEEWGSVFSLELIPNKELYTFFFEFGKDVEIISPKYIRTEMSKYVAELYKLYHS